MILPLQTSLQRLGLYLGKLDDTPGPLTADALVCALASHPPPMAGASLFRAIPAAWWGQPNRVAMLYAQINAETGFLLKCENLNYDADGLCRTWPNRFRSGVGTFALSDPRHIAETYAHNPVLIANAVYNGRMGNTGPCDGWNFRGRGWAQLTGRDEYEEMAHATGLDLVAQPELANDTLNAGRIAVAYAISKLGFLSHADAGDVSACRHLWNGGSIGLQTATESFDKVRLLWGNP